MNQAVGNHHHPALSLGNLLLALWQALIFLVLWMFPISPPEWSWNRSPLMNSTMAGRNFVLCLKPLLISMCFPFKLKRLPQEKKIEFLCCHDYLALRIQSAAALASETSLRICKDSTGCLWLANDGGSVELASKELFGFNLGTFTEVVAGPLDVSPTSRCQ